MAVRNRKTREFKDRQCRYCPLADMRAFRKGWPCCPVKHPKIENGHCRDKETADKKPKRKRLKKEGEDGPKGDVGD